MNDERDASGSSGSSGSPDQAMRAEDTARTPDTGAETSAGTEPAVDSPPSTVSDVEYRCDLCGAPMQEWHCRIICNFCGYQRDCSDP